MIENDATKAKIRSAMDLLIDTQYTDVPQLPEHIFVAQFLPILADTVSGQADLGRWLDVCGNAYRPVDVVRGKEVLFRVPPILKRHPTPGQSNGMSIGEIMAMAQSKSQVHPRLGENYMDQALGRVVQHTQTDLEQVAVWNDILRRYNYPLIEVKVPLPADPQTSSERPLFSDEYEDF